MFFSPDFRIQQATSSDIPLIFQFIRELAEYEKLSHEVTADEATLRESLFGARPFAEAVIGYLAQEPVAFALYFHTFSTFLGRPGLYLEDLFVYPKHRSKGFGQMILRYLANLAKERNCGRLEWSVLDWNEPAITFYRKIGAEPMEDWTVFRLHGENLKKLAEMNSKTNSF